MEIGPKYDLDGEFKAAARRHQSKYRAQVLQVGFNTYGNCLQEKDGRALLNYYPQLGVREALRSRYPKYSAARDANMLRSEHIPFNMIAPLIGLPELGADIVRNVFGVNCKRVERLEIEWAPKDRSDYLGDHTSFDTYLEVLDPDGRVVGIGVEVKYTEQGYPIGKSEASRVSDPNSTYWETTERSGYFESAVTEEIASDDLRQIWRNHLLGLSMRIRGDIDEFVSITLYPGGNKHFDNAIASYKRFLKPSTRPNVRGCRFEEFIEAIDGGEEVLAWKKYLSERYLVK